jgi:hypothetical protein
MGRNKVYATEAEATEAQKQQIKEANQRYRKERKEYREKVLNEQLQIVKLLGKTVIEDKEFLTDMLKMVEKITTAINELKEQKEKEDELNGVNNKKKTRTKKKVDAKSVIEEPIDAILEKTEDMGPHTSKDDIIKPQKPQKPPKEPKAPKPPKEPKEPKEPKTKKEPKKKKSVSPPPTPSSSETESSASETASENGLFL